MELTFIITDKKIKKRLQQILTGKKYNIMYLVNLREYRSIIKEYMPKYIILSENIDGYVEVKDFISDKTSSELIITGNKSLNINGNYLNSLSEEEAVIKAIESIENFEKKVKKKNYKIINQQVTTMFSVQGGVGKTSLAVNIAFFISKIRKIKVLLIDFNFCEGPGDMATNLGIPDTPNLNVLIENITQVPDSIWKSSITINDNLDVIQPPLSLDQSDKFKIDMLHELIFSARKKYNYIICDIPDNYDSNTFEVLNLSTKTIFILYPQMGGILRANHFLKFLPDSQDLIGLFNKVNLPEERIKKLKDALNLNIYNEIPYIEDAPRLFGFVNLQSQLTDLENKLI